MLGVIELKFKNNEKQEYESIALPLLKNQKVQLMKNFQQHIGTSTYLHCKLISQMCFLINRRLRLHCDEKALVAGAILHDFFLYDWHKENNPSRGKHGFIHPLIAARNARKYLKIDTKTEEIIKTHMWPLTITRIPKTREAWIVSCVDKYTTVKEVCKNLYKKISKS